MVHQERSKSAYRGCRALQGDQRGRPRPADDLGGGIFKKRLNENRYRSIVLAKGGHFWVCEYLFAKKDRANIEDDELDGFRKLAKA
jgi:hypothetical protein